VCRRSDSPVSGVGAAGGFTLIEVLAAVLIVSLVFGVLIESVTHNLHDLHRARQQARASRLAEEQMRGFLESVAAGEKLEDGVKEGTCQEPDEDLHWQISVSPQTLALPADYPGELSPSPLFAAPNEAPRPKTPGAEPLRLIEVRVYPEDVDPQSVAPFVVLATTPTDPARVQQQQQTQPQGGQKSGQSPGSPQPNTGRLE